MKNREAELYEQILQGDKQALEDLYNLYAESLYSLSYKITDRKELAEEVLQEVLMKLWTKKRKYDKSKGEFSKWMFTVTKNCSIDLLRTEEKEQHLKQKAVPFFKDNQNFAEKIELEDVRKYIRRQVSLLTEKQQEVVMLHYFKAMTHVKIAHFCGIPMGM